ncbi:hypothetical protein BKA67DRAFT_258460 [Truncatella angustata]|uniref:Uncharacterized protein n=1 Tax=Truncatella angustata TaxID=152316 RepID=A0A9P8UK95_9PEZI|nr:uncharacterized protein BKA67DRAFT_258460 [Truncatella angustata]KAH6653728.1 hypothetical protein BKA67DRAFT_258460 [Truncatella angustata]
MLPYIEVSDLPPSASFYSAVTHPLGLRYISANPGAIVYGAPSPTDPNTNTPVFEVRSVGGRAEPRQNARLVLSASSPSEVKAFYAAALRAYPDLPLIGGAEDQSHRHSDADLTSGNCRSEIRDLDGNIMEVVYLPPAGYPPSHNGSTVRRTSSTTHEVSRILDWNLDVATSQPSKSVVAGSPGEALARRPSATAEGEPYVLRRSVTTSVVETSTPPPQEKSNGLSTSAVVSTVLGAVAAGAAIGGALTYMNMRSQRDRAPRQDFDPPAFARRATEPVPDHRPRYVERTVEKVYYADQLPPVKNRHYPPPTYMAKYSQAGTQSREVEELDDRSSRHSTRQSTAGKSRTRSEAGSTRQPLMIADAEYMSAAGSKYTTNPKLLMDKEHNSQADYWSRAPSKHSVPRSMSRAPEEAETYVSSRSKHHEPGPRSYMSSRSKSYHEPVAETYVSSRSKSHAPDASTYVSSRSKRSERSDRSETTIRPVRQSTVYEAPQSVVYGEIPIRSAAPSRAPTKVHSKAPSRHSVARSSATTAMKVPVMSTAGSRAAPRMVPLPESHVSYTSHYPAAIPLPRSSIEYDDDNDSIAPSDSISCIGTRSRR